MSPRKPIGDNKAERIYIFLPPEILGEVKKEADSKGLSVSALIRMVVMEHINKK